MEEPWIERGYPGPLTTFEGERQVWMGLELADGWVVRYRLVPQHGQPVIAEIRVFHPEERAPRAFNKQLTGATVRELQKTQGPLPLGGLTARRIHGIPTGQPVKRFTRVLKQLNELAREDSGPSTGLALVGSVGFTDRAFEQTKRGRRPDMAKYLAVAALYADHCQAGSPHPVPDVAQELGLKISVVRSRINDSRHKYGLLTPATGTRAGGELTEKARKLIGGK